MIYVREGVEKCFHHFSSIPLFSVYREGTSRFIYTTVVEFLSAVSCFFPVTLFDGSAAAARAGIIAIGLFDGSLDARFFGW